MDELYRFVECVDDDCEKDELHEFVLVKRCGHGNMCRHLLTVLENYDRVWCEGSGMEIDDA